MTKQAVFRLTLATFAVTVFVNTSFAQDRAMRPLDISDRTIRRAVRDAEFERKYGHLPQAAGPFRRKVREERVKRLRVFTIDTRDQAKCEALKKALANLQPMRFEDSASQLCDVTSSQPVASIVLIDQVDTVEFRKELDKNFLLSSEKNLATDTRNFAIGMGGAMGVLWMMPESVTKWDKQRLRETNMFDNYIANIKAGPVWDNDPPIMNYVAHPIAGAATYTLARSNGRSPLESFGYSFAMSTFFWEYGFEALIEPPSYQDLIITPIIGAVLGESAHRLEQMIADDGGRLLDSKPLGSLAMVVLNPAGSFSKVVNRVAGSPVLQNSKAEFVMRRYKTQFGGESNMMGLQFSFDFKAF